ncbi:hypothetical protein [Azospirillum largimobile]
MPGQPLSHGPTSQSGGDVPLRQAASGSQTGHGCLSSGRWLCVSDALLPLRGGIGQTPTAFCRPAGWDEGCRRLEVEGSQRFATPHPNPSPTRGEGLCQRANINQMAVGPGSV